MKRLFGFVFAAMMLIALTAPAMAGEFKLGGIIFTDFYHMAQDEENSAGGGESISNTKVKVPNISRLIGKWSNDSGVGMWIELGLRGQGVNKRDTVIRQANAWWQVNPGFRITAGQAESGFAPLSPSQLLGTDSGWLNVIGAGFGNLYPGRDPLVKFDITPSDAFTFTAAFVDPNIACVGYDNDGVAKNWGNNNTVMPRVDLSMQLKLGPVTLYPGAMYANKTFENVADGSDDEITTYAGSIGLKAGFGPVSIAGEFNMGENWGDQDFLGIGLESIKPAGTTPTYYGAALAYTDAAGNNKIADSELMGAWVDVSFKLGPATPHLLWGMQTYENEMNPDISTDDFEQTCMMYGVSIPIKLTNMFILRPEVMMYDLGEREVGNVETDRGSFVLAGVQFQVVF